MATRTIRSIARIVDSAHTLEGGGFEVHRPFPTRQLSDFDPFLLLDRMGPTDVGPGEAKGAPDHPHRGFETVTYMLDGGMRHQDSAGNSGKLDPGDVQWMTAGAGVVHSELPAPQILEKGGRMHGFQLWVNLPKKDKMIPPRYQDTPSAKIPVAQTPDGKVRVKVIAGESLGQKAVIQTRTPILYLHATLQPGGKLEQPVSADYNVFAFVFSGEAEFSANSQGARENQAVLFKSDGDWVRMSVPTDAASAAEILLIGGIPLNEPVARYGPFVMNTETEIAEAIYDFRTGKLGKILQK